VVATAALLDTLPTPSTDGVDKVCLQLKGILSVTATQKAESSLQRWAKISISSPGQLTKERYETPHGGYRILAYPTLNMSSAR
jgi:hypothetical protein